MTRFLVLISIIILTVSRLAAQNDCVKWDSIVFDKNLSDSIFSCTDSGYDDYEFKNVAIDAACLTHNGEMLNACDGFIKNDTIIINIYFGVSRGILTYLIIKMHNKSFSSHVSELLTILPDWFEASAVRQKLILQTNAYTTAKQINGYVNFVGKGKYTQNQIDAMNSFLPVINDNGINENRMTDEQIEKGYEFSIKGYFRCKLK